VSCLVYAFRDCQGHRGYSILPLQLSLFLNEVGGNPEPFGVVLPVFHKACGRCDDRQSLTHGSIPDHRFPLPLNRQEKRGHYYAPSSLKDGVCVRPRSSVTASAHPIGPLCSI
jgi:hypothetical protein